jgi:4a-hydroxytetrahydrobiopterin dehydratase
MTLRQPLADVLVDSALAPLPGWKRVGSGEQALIEKTFPFPDYAATLAFVNRVAQAADAQDHHPDMLVQWGRCTVRFSTHSAKAVTAADIEAARHVETLVR